MTDTIAGIWSNLLSQQWEGTPVWELINDKKYTAAPAFEGEKYRSSQSRIMYIGHAVNGWEVDVSSCTSPEATLEWVRAQNSRDAMETIVNRNGFKSENGGRTYYHIRSKFFRMIHEILQNLGETEGPIDESTWYDKDWQQKFVWSNLYCIAPRNGGNPDDKFIKPLMRQFVDMVSEEISLYQPNTVICCPLQGYFQRWKRRPSFIEICDKDTFKWCEKAGSSILGIGRKADTRIIVARRPDRWGNSYAKVKEMADMITEEIIKGN